MAIPQEAISIHKESWTLGPYSTRQPQGGDRAQRWLLGSESWLWHSLAVWIWARSLLSLGRNSAPANADKTNHFLTGMMGGIQ